MLAFYIFAEKSRTRGFHASGTVAVKSTCQFNEFYEISIDKNQYLCYHVAMGVLILRPNYSTLRGEYQI